MYAGSATTYITLQVADTNVSDYCFFDNVSVFEKTPGIVAANNLGPDGWSKASALDVWREHSGSNTKGGSFYSLKGTSTAGSQQMIWPLTRDSGNLDSF